MTVLDFAGAVEWTRHLHMRYSWLAVQPELFVVEERGTRIVGLNPVDGSARWDVGGGAVHLAAAAGRCFILGNDRLRCLDLHTAQPRWEAAVSSLSMQATVAGNAVLCGGIRGYRPLRSFDIDSGAELWSRDIHTRTPFAVPGGVLLTMREHTRAVLLDPLTGREFAGWELPEPAQDGWRGSPFTPIGSHRYLVRCGEHGVVEIDPRHARVTPVFRHHRPLMPDIDIAAGLVFLREVHGGLLALNPEDWTVRWRFDPGILPATGVVPLADGFVIAANFGGSLYQLDDSGAPMHRTTITNRRLMELLPIGSGHFLAKTKTSLLYIGL